MVVGGVLGELVPNRVSLFYGNIQGIFSASI
jgi:hypothetical protein